MKSLILLYLAWVPTAFAEAESQQPAWAPMMPLVLMFGVLYFLIIRPQQKKAKTHKNFLNDLKRGDMVITNGGFIGVVKSLGEKLVTLEVDKNVCMKVLRNQILDSANSLKDNKATT